MSISIGVAIKGEAGRGGDPVVVNAPTNLDGTGSFPPATADLTWTVAVAGTNPVASYDVFRDDAFIANTALTTYSDTGTLLADTAYKYEVRTVDILGRKSELSPHINVAIPSLILLDAPTGSSISSWDYDTARYTWDAVVQGGASFPVASYNVYLRDVFVENTTNLLAYLNPVIGISSQYSAGAVDTDGNEGALGSALFTHDPVNIIANTELAGGALSGPSDGNNPPTDWSIGFNTAVSQPIDIGGGFFEWEQNHPQDNARCYLTFQLDSHIGLVVGAVYRVTMEMESINDSAVIVLSVSSATDVTVDLVQNRIFSGETNDVIADITIDDTGYNANIRMGIGVTSGVTAALTLRTPAMYLRSRPQI